MKKLWHPSLGESGKDEICGYFFPVVINFFTLLLGVRKNIRPVKNGVMWCWHGYVSGASASDLHLVELIQLPPSYLLLH